MGECDSLHLTFFTTGDLRTHSHHVFQVQKVQVIRFLHRILIFIETHAFCYCCKKNANYLSPNLGDFLICLVDILQLNFLSLNPQFTWQRKCFQNFFQCQLICKKNCKKTKFHTFIRYQFCSYSHFSFLTVWNMNGSIVFALWLNSKPFGKKKIEWAKTAISIIYCNQYYVELFIHVK